MGPQEKIIGRHDAARAAVRAPVEPVPQAEREAPDLPLWHRALAAALQGLLALAIIAGGYLGYQYIMAGAPVAERAERPRIARLVEVVAAEPHTQSPVITAWGEVVPAQTLVVRPEVGGMLEWVHPELTPGGLLAAGEVIARIDARDLTLAVARAEAAIAGIEARIQVERGQASVAERDLERMPRNLSDEQRALVLREPQMAELGAELAAARAALDEARNALARAEIRTPFDAVVLGEEIAPGAMIAAGSEVARIVATGRFEVTMAVPASVLDWIDPDAGQPVAIRQPSVWAEGAEREGRVVRLGAALSESGRMARLVVEVPDPLALAPANEGEPKLLLGSYVEGAIEGRPVPEAVALERAWLHDGDTVWIMAPDDTLEVRAVEVAWRGADTVLVAGGLAEGERVVTTPLATHAPGMALRTRGAADRPPEMAQDSAGAPAR